MRKDDMPAFVPYEAVAIDVRSGMSADAVRFLVQNPVVIAEFVETVRGAQPGRARSDDDNLLLIHNFQLRGINLLIRNDLADLLESSPDSNMISKRPLDRCA